MAKKYIVSLTNAERERLNNIIENRSIKSPVLKRAYILLQSDVNGPGWKDEAIKSAYGVSICTIERLRERFIEDGFEVALEGKKRMSGWKIKFDGRVEAQLVAQRCSSAPSGHNKWTLNLLADRLVVLEVVEGISREQVRRMLKKMNLSLGK